MRTSKRNIDVIDQDSIEKATKLKACKNLDGVIGKSTTLKNISFMGFDDSILIDK